MNLINYCVSFVSSFVWNNFISEISIVLGSKLLAKKKKINKGIVHLFQMCLTFFPLG